MTDEPIQTARLLKAHTLGVLEWFLDQTEVALTENQFRALRKLALRHVHGKLNDTFLALEGAGMLRPCACLSEIRSAVSGGAAHAALEQLDKQVREHEVCGGTGFQDMVVVRRVTDAGQDVPAAQTRPVTPIKPTIVPGSRKRGTPPPTKAS